MGKEHDLDSVVAEIKAALAKLGEADSDLGRRLSVALERAVRSLEAAQPVPEPTEPALAKVPALLAAFARCLPVTVDEAALTVLAAEPIDLDALRFVEERVGPLRVVAAPLEVVWTGIEQAYGDRTESERVVPTFRPERTDVVDEPVESAPEPMPANEPAAESAGTIAEVEQAEEQEATPEPASPEGRVVREATDEEFASLMAEVQQQAEGQPLPSNEEPPGDIHEPRMQNLDLLDAFEAVSTPVSLTDPIEPVAGMSASGAVQPPADPSAVQAEISRLDALLGDEPAEVPVQGAIPDGLVPAELAFQALCAPVAIEEGELRCLIADPPDTTGAGAIAKAAGMPLRLQVCSREEVIAALEARYGPLPEPAVTEAAKKPGLLGGLKQKLKKAA